MPTGLEGVIAAMGLRALRALFRKTYSANRLKEAEWQRWRTLPEKDRRRRVSIGVIDDSPFPPKANLENLGYRIQFLGDPSSLDVVVPHHIILCDLQGVGTNFDVQKQGAFLIDEIKKNHPDKFVIAYTGGTMNLSVTRDAVNSADLFVKKDAGLEEWRDKLDGLVVKLLDPYEIWHRQRIALAMRGVDSQTMAEIESAFTQSVVERRSDATSPFLRTVNSSGLSGDARAVLQSLVASGLFELAVGG